MLTVLSVAYSLAPVGPDAVGGAEQVLSALDEALVAAGHRSVVVACQGSSVAGELVATPPVPCGTIGDAERRGAQAATRKAMEGVLRREPVDVVHMHGLDFAACLPASGPPVLATLHLPPLWYPREALVSSRPGIWLQCVSMSQHASCPRGSELLPPIANGVDVERLSEAAHAKRGFALMLARICPEKGVHVALDAARAASASLLIGGEVFSYPEHRAYFADLIEPRLDHRRRFLGPLGFSRKRRLLCAARCLLVPSLAPETSSLVAMEALACGTPVIAFRAGALAEIVEHGRTGFLVRDAGEMAAAIGRVETIDPAACRAAARARFSRTRMVDEYFARYAALAARVAA
ncbi:MAG: glycosyltransferase [Alphaproteobacteria bacterium]|nr:glycosyltransferase [Alphaproteobacteria bacterium]